MNNELNKMSRVKQSIITAVSIALCVVLPLAFHSIPQAGLIYCPMHIPVLICGLVCDWQFGLACGIIGPVVSSVITGMPSIVDLPSMMIELVIYGVVCALIMKVVHTKKLYVDLYLSLVVAMLLGRVVAGIVKALIFARGSMTVTTWATTYFVTCLPGIIIQLVLIPSIYFALEKANLIPARYLIDDED
jgi:hypothetical protein